MGEVETASAGSVRISTESRPLGASGPPEQPSRRRSIFHADASWPHGGDFLEL
jgi:hypothetical protein